MRKLAVSMFLSLDGVFQAPGAPDEDTNGGFEHGGWLVPYLDEQLEQYMTDFTTGAGALLLGRKTYEIFAGSWPLAPDDDPVGATLNRIPKYVASRTLDSLQWNNSTLLGEDIPGEVARLKAQDGGEIQTAGSGALIQILLKHDLVDEFRLQTFPVIIGSGKRLFSEGTIPRGLELTDSTLTSTGVLMNTYQRAGALTYGAVGYEQPGSKEWRVSAVDSETFQTTI